MTTIISIIQIILSALLIFAVILQVRGVGLSPTFGGLQQGGETYRQRRGLEKFLLYATMVLIVLMALTTIAQLWV